jgi:nucleotide-binding universal stress UspA family protein
VNVNILVGVDGSASSLAAVDLAAQEAMWRGATLRIVHAFAWPYMHVPLGPSEVGPPSGGLRHAAERIVSDAMERADSVLKSASSGFAEIAVTGDVIDGFAAATMLAEGESASLIVLGDRGLGGFTGLLIGSVAVQVSAHATRPVLICRGRPDPAGPVVVGVDVTDPSSAAIDLAFDEASLRHAPLTAIAAVTHAPVTAPGGMPLVGYDDDELTGEARLRLRSILARARDAHPDVPVVAEVVHGRPRRVLANATATAALIVVGSHGRGAAEGLILGSVSQAVMRRAACPVAVTPTAAAAPEEP